MSDTFANLRRTVLQAVREEHKLRKPSKYNLRLLAVFVRIRLKNLGLSEAQFAQLVRLSPNQVNAFFEGTLAASQFTDEFLRYLSHVIQCDVNQLRIIMNRPTETKTKRLF